MGTHRPPGLDGPTAVSGQAVPPNKVGSVPHPTGTAVPVGMPERGNPGALDRAFGEMLQLMGGPLRLTLPKSYQHGSSARDQCARDERERRGVGIGSNAMVLACSCEKRRHGNRKPQGPSVDFGQLTAD